MLRLAEGLEREMAHQAERSCDQRMPELMLWAPHALSTINGGALTQRLVQVGDILWCKVGVYLTSSSATMSLLFLFTQCMLESWRRAGVSKRRTLQAGLVSWRIWSFRPHTQMLSAQASPGACPVGPLNVER